MRLGFFGSRTLWDDRVRCLIHSEIDKHKPDEIITSAEAGGVCKEARIMARMIAIPLKVHFLNFRKCAGAFEFRSKSILRDCDHMVLIHDGESHGTSNELELAKKLGTPITYHLLEPEEQLDPRSAENQCQLF